MDSTVPKYIKRNGLLQKNPDHPDNKKASTLSAKSLVPVCSVSDLAAQNESGGVQIDMSESTAISIDILQDADCTLTKYKGVVNAGVIIDGLSDLFNEFEIPLGLMSKIQELSTDEFHLVFLIDDSSSMGRKDSVKFNSQNFEILCSRWEEVHERLLITFRFLAFVPVQSITIQFINRASILNFKHSEHSPASFYGKVERDLNSVFASPPSGATMLVDKLQSIFTAASHKASRTAVYLYCDGSPSDIDGPRRIREMMLARNARHTPFSFMSCTGNDADVEWAKGLDELVMKDNSPSYIAELDDYPTERSEVEHDQGSGIPYSYGFYIICNLVASMNPSDLDALDESIPLTKRTIDNLMGRVTDMKEYEYYFQQYLDNPKKTSGENALSVKLWKASFPAFCTIHLEAYQLDVVQKHMQALQAPPPYSV